MIHIESLTFSYKQNRPVFDEFNWQTQDGERWAVIGPSGCGKTTLLYILAGLRVPCSGCVNYRNSRAGSHSQTRGLILQDYGLLPWMTAYQNISLGLKIRKFEKNKIKEITSNWLEELNISDIADHYPSEMSGGQRQRTAIARTLALEPSLLLMDEPFASLDTITREDLLNLTLKLSDKLLSTMILVTHNIEEAVFWGLKILILTHSPNTDTNILDNRMSGSKGFRNSTDFRRQCEYIRNLLKKST